MCGRFFVDAKNREIDRLLTMLPEDAPEPKTGEIFPTDNAIVLTSGDKAESMSWGFPKYDGKGVIFNARAETALQKPMFAKSLRARPAAIPASGFYEWHETDGRKEKFLFTDLKNPLLYLAGFWNFFGSGPNPRHFTILTTAANASMLPYHHRMPVLLDPDEISGWLDGSNLQKFLEAEPISVKACKE